MGIQEATKAAHLPRTLPLWNGEGEVGKRRKNRRCKESGREKRGTGELFANSFQFQGNHTIVISKITNLHG